MIFLFLLSYIGAAKRHQSKTSVEVVTTHPQAATMGSVSAGALHDIRPYLSSIALESLERRISALHSTGACVRTVCAKRSAPLGGVYGIFDGI